MNFVETKEESLPSRWCPLVRNDNDGATRDGRVCRSVRSVRTERKLVQRVPPGTGDSARRSVAGPFVRGGTRAVGGPFAPRNRRCRSAPNRDGSTGSNAAESERMAALWSPDSRSNALGPGVDMFSGTDSSSTSSIASYAGTRSSRSPSTDTSRTTVPATAISLSAAFLARSSIDATLVSVFPTSTSIAVRSLQSGKQTPFVGGKLRLLVSACRRLSVAVTRRG